MGALVFGLSHYHQLARVQTVQIHGNAQASDAAVRHLAGVRLDDPLLLLDLDRVIHEVARHPWVADVTVRRALPGELHIEVREHSDALLLAHAGGLYRVNREAQVFIKARGAGLDLPVLTGVDDELITEPVVGRTILRSALDVLATIDEADSLRTEQVSELHFDRDLGFTILLRDGGVVCLGFRSPQDQLRRLDAMVGAGLDLSIPQRIDLDLDGIAVATPLAT